ncbi:MAG: MBL fold metallo-hydrolase [Phycisphaeraceae bacterium]|nr:MBL fold metallo-hydrolase [Phycisphaeraceae bacterium]
MLTRRDFLGTSGLALAGLLAAPARARRAPRDLPFFEWKELRDGVWATIDQSSGGNVAVFLGARQSIIVDAKFAWLSRTLRREADQLGGADSRGNPERPLRLLINTHHHADHTGGNIGFSPDMDVLAHENAAPRIENQFDAYGRQLDGAIESMERAAPDNEKAREEAAELRRVRVHFEPGDWVPGRVAKGERTELDEGGIRLTLHAIGPGHTDNDLIVHSPERNVLHAGDLLFYKRHPFIDLPSGASSIGWIESVKRAIALCDDQTIVIPGHGEITDVTGLRGQVEYLQALRTAAKRAVEAGTPREEFLGTDLPIAADYGFEQIKPRAFGAVYDEVSAGK